MTSVDTECVEDSTTSQEPVDAVFVIGTGSKNNNEELKYALRNLERNCPFIRDVYISGECPDWVDTTVVRHLKWPDRFTHAKDANIIDKLRHACEHTGIAKKILFCSDDQFQTRPCSWEDFRPRWLRQYSPSDPWYDNRKRIWHGRLRRTLERDRIRRVEEGKDTDSIYYYQPHIWMPIDRDKFIEYAIWSDYEHRDDTIIASGYFNYVGAKGESNFDHVFISTVQKWPVDATHVAYTDSSYSAAMSYLRSEFPNKSVFEIQDMTSRHENHKTAEGNNKRSDEDIISDMLSTINGNSAWLSMSAEATIAEKMRAENADGWKKVWNDIIRRWSSDTKKGAFKSPVTSLRSAEADKFVKAFMSSKMNDVRQLDLNNAGRQKRCTKCEERRMGIAHRHDLIGSRQSPEPEIDKSHECLECICDHISVSIAYMNSNAGRPTPFEILLARGELQVAANSLLSLGMDDVYNECILTLDSASTNESTFSVYKLKEILRKIMETK